MNYLESVPLDIKTIDADKGTFEGYAAVFDKPDSMQDVIAPGAFKKSLKTRGATKVKMLLQHDHRMLLGVWTSVKEDKTGLFVKGRLLLELDRAKEAFILLREEVLDSMSIGFRTIVDSFDSKTEVRTLHEVDLVEISLVAVPAQPDAVITAVKQLTADGITNKKELESALRDAGFSKKTSSYITAGWSPPARRDAGGSEAAARIRRVAESIRTATGGQRYA